MRHNVVQCVVRRCMPSGICTPQATQAVLEKHLVGQVEVSLGMFVEKVRQCYGLEQESPCVMA